MSFTDGPIMVSAALFVSLVFLDLFRHEYKLIPVHAIIGFFAVVLMTVLCERGSYLMAWTILVSPFLILFAGFTMREYKLLHTPPYPVAPINIQQPKPPKHQPAPYYM